MRRADATAFLATALAVLLVNAVAAIAIGCLLYAGHQRFSKSRSGAPLGQLQTE